MLYPGDVVTDMRMTASCARRRSSRPFARIAVFVLLFSFAAGIGPQTVDARSYLVKTEPGRGADVARVEGADVVSIIPRARLIEVEIADGDLGPALARLANATGVENVRPEGVFEATEQEVDPDDPWFPQQWWLDRISAPEAWGRVKGDTLPIVAVLDSGVELDSPEFAGRIVSPVSFAPAGDDAQDPDGHGTLVSSIALAAGDNSFGGAGVAWEPLLMPVRLGNAGFPADPKSFGEAEVIQGLYYAADHGADVINMSFAAPAYEGHSEDMAEAVAYAAARGAVLVAAAGNGAGGDPTYDGVGYPASDPNVIAVGAVERDLDLAGYSSWGPGLEIVAPGGTSGEKIVGLGLGGEPATGAGTSYAAPMVAGAAALLLQSDPSLSRHEIRSLLTYSAKDLGLEGRDDTFGFGLLDVDSALESVEDDIRPFTDVLPGHPYKVAIETLAREGIIVGFADGSFRPDDPVLRQQFAKMIVLTEEIHTEPVDNAARQTFADLGPSAGIPYPFDYVEEAAGAGIILGYPDGRFRPYLTITRAQLITMVVRAADVAQPPAGYQPEEFGNFDATHYPQARAAAYAGLLDGLEGLGPGYDFWRRATRGEVSALLYELLRLK